MELYKNKEAFLDAIIEASRTLKINESLLEKDYFVMFVLKELNKCIPGLLFKGGTCCSHAYHAINRFSEDIDLSLDNNHFGRRHNINANKKIVEVCDRLGFRILNRDEVINHSHSSFNRYYVEYPIIFSSLSIKPFIQIEMYFHGKSYPEEIKKVNSLVGDWLINIGNETAAKDFELIPFEVCVQKIERTFVDKVFAICDYFERHELERNSRHIYDLYMISKIIDLSDQSLLKLVEDVRKDRKSNNRCLSAQDGYDINSTLRKIKDSNVFESDYNNVTVLLLTEIVTYIEASSIFDTIINLKIF